MFVFHTKDGERYGLFGLGCKVQSLGIGSRIFDVMGKEVHDHEQEENTGKGHEDEINISSIEEEGEGKHGVNTYAIGTSPTGEQEENKVEENAERIQVLEDRNDVVGKEVHDHEQEENTGKGHEDEINISSIEEEGEGKHGVNTYAIGTSPTGEQEVNKVEENAERIQVLDDRKGEAEPSVIGTSTGEQEEQNKVKKTRKEYKYSTILGRENLVPC